ncbi:MAG: GMC family oxidoreductase N-terminal domain-containing protein [Novosphingobium sp.]|nr:GMC family oxidoreductase N-terminal domain-containing protein [Novosphingobium sp.]
MAEFDYVIVGAGSAGCVLANRLSADPNVTVALVEFGGRDRHPYIHMPKGIGKMMSMPSLMWHYMTTPGPNNPMPDIWLRGKGLGGSSSVNGMVWVKGQPADYEELADRAGERWGWEQFSGAFEAIESHELGAAPSRGGSGPLKVTLPACRSVLTDAMAEAGDSIGWPVKDDVNQPDDGEGIGLMPCSIWQGKRQSAAVAFLKLVRARKNLTIITGALTDTVLLEGKKAVGIHVLQDGKPREISARHEVILSAGAIASPAILERSGIGDPSVLEEQGVPIAHALPEVGKNVTEHRAIRMQWRLKQPLSINQQFSGLRLVGNVLRYYLTHKGPMAGAAIEVRAAYRSTPERNRADIQAQIGLFSWDLDGEGGALETEHGFCAIAYPMVPASVGSIHITSRDPQVPPEIDTQYGAAQEDRDRTVAAAHRLREWAAAEPLASLIECETTPGPEAESDEAILECMDRYGTAGLHTVGSCRMGKDDASVVDPSLRVRGIDGLRVIDASVFPVIPSGNTNAPVIALAWLASDMIVGGE